MNLKKFVVVLFSTVAFLIPAVALMQTAPSSPASVSLTSNAGYILVSWQSNTDATHYNIERSANGGSTFSSLSSNLTMAYYSDSSVTSGSSYMYKVQACKSGFGCSSYTYSSSITYSGGGGGGGGGGTIPSAPSSASASASSGYVYVSWPMVTDATHYSVERSTNSGTYSSLSSGFSSNYYNDTSVTSGSSYSYKVYACKSGYGCSTTGTISNTASYTSGTSPTVDVKVDGADGTVSRTAPANYTVTWTTTGDPTSCTPGGTWSTSGTKSVPSGSHDFLGVTVSGLKTYTLTCSNSYGSASDTVYVEIVSSSDTQSPSIPTGLSSTAYSSSQVNLSWTASTDNVAVTGYKVYRNGSYITSVTATSYSDTGLTTGTSYSYTVAAYDSANNLSSQSASATVTTTSGGSSATLSVTSNPSGATVSNINSGYVYCTSTPCSVQVAVPPNSINIRISKTGYYDWTNLVYTYTGQTTNVDATLTSSSGTTSGSLTPPSSSSATSMTGKVQVTWPAGSGASKYTIYRSLNGGSFSLWYTNITSLYYDDLSISQGSSYQYRVYSCESNGTTCSTSYTTSNSVTYSGGNQTCTGLNLTLNDGKTTYTIGDTVNYTWTCTPGGTASNVSIWLQKPDGTSTNYNSGTGSATMTLGFGTSNLSTGTHILKACFSTTCSTVTASQTFTMSYGSGGSSTVNHTWTFLNNATANSYILNRTDSEYLNYISSVETLCRAISVSQYTWKPNAGDSTSTNWQNFGIPECSVNTNTTATTTTTTTNYAPGAPGNVNASVNGSNVTINWTDYSSNETNFTVYRKLSSGSSFSPIGTVGANVATYIDSGLVNGSYDYLVLSSNSYGYSGNSNTYTISVGGTSGGGVPNSPPYVSASSNTGYIYVNWPAVTDATHYSIDRSVNSGSWMYLSSGFNTPSFSDSGVVSGSTYSYRVRSCKSGYGCSTPDTVSGMVSYSGTTVGTTPAVDTITPPSVNNFGYNLQANGFFRAGASFSKPIDGTTVSANTIYIVEVATGNKISGNSAAYYSGVDYVTSIAPKVNTDYQLVVKNIRDLHGNYMVGIYTSPYFRNASTTATTVVSTTTISSGWVNHTWSFSNGGVVNSYILNRTDAEYLAYISHIESLCRTVTSSQYVWKPGAGDSSAVNWRNFGIPECSSSVTTATTTTINTGAPVISALHAENITRSGVQIKWTTNILSDSRILYGTSLYYGQTSFMRCDGGGYVIEHCINLAGLSPGIRYLYKAVSTGQNGYSAEMGGFQFVASTTSGIIATTATTTATTLPKTMTEEETTVIQKSGAFSISAIDINGTVIAAAPINAWQSGSNVNYYGMTDEKGQLKLPVFSGEYTLEINPPSGRGDLIRPVSVKLIIGAGVTVPHTFIFSRNVKKITGVVQYSNGTPIAFANLGAYSEEGRGWISAQTDKDGLFEISVSGGKWRVTAYPPKGVSWQAQPVGQEIIFPSDASGESRKVIINIPSTSSTVVVRATLSGGGVVSGAGITIDSARGAESKAGSGRVVIYKQADTNGSATFILPPGKYYVRGSAIDDLYFNPEEKEFTVVEGDTASVSITFNTRNTLSGTVTISGTAVKEDKTPIADAMIGAWSEKGGFRDTKTGTDGSWNLLVPTGDRWHVRAGKEIDRYPYMSTEVTVEATGTPPSIEMVLTRPEEKLPKPVEVSRKVEEESVAKTTDGAKITIPANSVSNIVGGSVNVEITPTVEVSSQAGAQVLSTVYDVSMTDSYGKELKNFNKDIEIEIPYDPEELKKQGVTEDTIKPSYFDEERKMWITIDTFTLDKKRHIIIARVNHLTRFAIVSAADVTPPESPSQIFVVAKTGGLAIAWSNPSVDFDHAKVYRSEEQNSLGSVIATEVPGTSYIDSSTSRGAKYFYTVRSVDPAGNESTNTNQASGVGVGAVVSAVAKQASSSGSFTRNLKQGDSGGDVTLLQNILTKEGFFKTTPTGFFGPITAQAVVKFQEKYSSEVLTPAGLSKGTGLVGKFTRQKLTALNSN